MNKFYRVTDAEMEVLAGYMDDEIREAVHSRFALALMRSFLGQVLLRSGISKEAIEEVLNIEVSEFEETFAVINSIKDFMYCTNHLNSLKMIYPGRDFVTERVRRVRITDYIWDKYAEFLNVLRKIFLAFKYCAAFRSISPRSGIFL